MLHPILKKQVLNVLQSSIKAKTGESVKDCKLYIEKNRVTVTIETENLGSKCEELGGKEKTIIINMFYDKACKTIAEKSKDLKQIFLQNEWIIVEIDFTNHIFNFYSENLNKKNQNYFCNFNF